MRRAALMAVVALVLASPAAAQQNPLTLGHWLNTYRDPQPRHSGSYVYDLRYFPNGQAVLILTVTNGQTRVMWNYRMTDANGYDAVAVDYAPKQNCVAVCLPMPPLVPMGTQEHCTFALQGVAMDLSCNGQQAVRYTHQP
jgi:hypothetical protein